MPKKTNKSVAETKEYLLYVIADLEQKLFYVGNTPEKRRASEYWEHYTGRRSATKELFEHGKSVGKDPKMYFLTTVVTTKSKANSYMIPYIKFFLNKGFQSLNSSTMIDFTKDLEPENQEVYDYIQSYEVEMLCNEERDLYPDYSEIRNKKKESSPDKITINVTEEDYSLLKKRAERNNMTITKYVRQIVVYEANIVEVNFDTLNESIDALREIEATLEQILYTIYRTKQYYPEDLTLLQTMIDEIKNEEKKILSAMKREIKKMNQLLK